MMKIDEILKSLPHRYPFLLVDRIIEVGEDYVKGLKNVTINEPFFQGHFPGKPIMPGVLIIEAMAQVGGCLLLKDVPDKENKLVYFMGIDRARFRKPIIPGDQIIFELKVLQKRSNTCKLWGEAKVDGNLCAEAELLSIMVDKE
ncbi:MAG: 3-hydroxyacyl-ACP dehydratase FabZ [Thermoanaerobaculia bacterium]